ncbi:hypothetical protein Peur_007540 [Populus x canadensis]
MKSLPAVLKECAAAGTLISPSPSLSKREPAQNHHLKFSTTKPGEARQHASNNCPFHQPPKPKLHTITSASFVASGLERELFSQPDQTKCESCKY